MEILFSDYKIERFMRSLEVPVAAKVLRTIDLLEEFGNKLGLPHSRHLGGRLLELRIRGKKEVRIIYTFHKERAILLHAFVKKGRRISKRELSTALERLRVLDHK